MFKQFHKKWSLFVSAMVHLVQLLWLVLAMRPGTSAKVASNECEGDETSWLQFRRIPGCEELQKENKALKAELSDKDKMVPHTPQLATCLNN